MNKPCLHPALDPARPLFVPDRIIHRRIFNSAPGDNIDTITETGKPHTKVSVLRHIIGVPPANLIETGSAKMIGSTAQRNNKTL